MEKELLKIARKPAKRLRLVCRQVRAHSLATFGVHLRSLVESSNRPLAFAPIVRLILWLVLRLIFGGKWLCMSGFSCTGRRSTTLRSHSSATHKHMPSRQGDTMYAHTAIGHLLRYKHTRNRTLVLSHEKVFSPSNRIAHKRKSNRTAVLLVF